MIKTSSTNIHKFFNFLYMHRSYLVMYITVTLIPLVYLILCRLTISDHSNPNITSASGEFLSFDSPFTSIILWMMYFFYNPDHNELVIFLYLISIYYFIFKYFTDRLYPPQNRFNRDVLEVLLPIILFNLPATFYIWLGGFDMLKAFFINIVFAEIFFMFLIVVLRWGIIGTTQLFKKVLKSI